MKKAKGNARRWLLTAFVFTALVPSLGVAGLLTAVSCSSFDVQTAINTATDGDTVLIPPGSCTWTSGVTIPGKAIKLSASGSVTLTNSTGTTGTKMVTVMEAQVGHVEVSNLHFVQGANHGSPVITLNPAAGGKAILIHHNTFVFTAASGDAINTTTNRGVIWSNAFTGPWPQAPQMLNANAALRCKLPITEAQSSWSTPSTTGTADVTGESNVYFEDNTIANFTTEALDPDDGCRIVIRFNTFDHSGLASHGRDTSPVGVRHWELYNNNFTFTNFGDCDGSRTANLNYWFYIRGGRGIIADNNMPNISSCAWGNKPEIIMTVMPLRRNVPCWTGGYPQTHQVGQSHDGATLLTEPVYIWNNTGLPSGNPFLRDYTPNQCGETAPSAIDFVVADRDYILDVAEPNYSKYPYPHPLALSPTSPVAPSSLQVR